MAVQFIVEHPTEYTTHYRVVDEDSGEILFERFEEDVDKAFAAGRTEATALVHVSRWENDEGNICYAFVVGDKVRSSWEKRPKVRKRTPKWALVSPEKTAALSDKAKVALFTLIPLVRKDGLVRSRKRSKQGRKQELLDLLGRRGFDALTDEDVLTEEDGKFYVSREYVARG